LNLPWVERVTVRRVWPDAIEMVVVEQEPLARWGKQRLISKSGTIFKPSAGEIPAGLPELSGPDERAALVTSNYKAYSESMALLGLGVKRLTADSRMAWSIVFQNGMVVKLGKGQPQKRLSKFAALYRILQKADSRQVQRVDLRYTNGASVLWGEAQVPTKEHGEGNKTDHKKVSRRSYRAALAGRGQV